MTLDRGNAAASPAGSPLPVRRVRPDSARMSGFDAVDRLASLHEQASYLRSAIPL